MVEIMAPAGSFETLQSAIKAGAQSVYFGVGKLNMRSHSANFTNEDLEEVVNICKENNVRSYLALNTILYDEDLVEAKALCDLAKKLGISAVIISDVSLMKYANSIELEIHLSTQCNVSNIDAVKFYSKYADVIVLARELTLEQIKKIIEEINKKEIRGPSGKLIQIELFIHGALCVAISGKCYMSLAQYNKSANRGECLQACRRSYLIKDDETGDELVVDNKFIMSPSDLCTIGMMDQILSSGVSILKIEGRGRGSDYVYTVVKVYREAVDNFSKEKVIEWRNELETVFNRGFWEGGYYLGKKAGEWSGVYGSKATKKKVTVGTVINYFSKVSVAEIFINTNELKLGDDFQITGPTTGLIKGKVEEIWLDDNKVEKTEKGQTITMKIPEKVRKNDLIFKIVS
jgi:U32 family peptidase